MAEWNIGISAHKIRIFSTIADYKCLNISSFRLFSYPFLPSSSTNALYLMCIWHNWNDDLELMEVKVQSNSGREKKEKISSNFHEK